MVEWGDLRHFLAVARTGTTLGAARLLGVNQTTCARRIAVLEDAIGAALFERHRDGYRLTQCGEDVVAEAEAVEASVARFLNAVTAGGRQVSGTIRITTVPELATHVFAPAIRDFRQAYPGVSVEIMLGERRADIAGGEADIALRAGPKPTDPCLVARQVAKAQWGAYCSRDYAARNGVPTGLADMAPHPLVLLDVTPGDYLEKAAPACTVVSRSDTVANLLILAHAGLGVTALPCITGDEDPQLTRCFTLDDISIPIWLIYHERQRGVPHIRAFLDFLLAHMLAIRPRLGGNAGSVGGADA